jgi:23S rRNA (cytidine1920-2'-O)/16S rRNA (cytidine1409-2'-O)-methyltransferase
VSVPRRRLDLLLVERGLATSREEAQRLLLAGKVRVAGQRAEKPGSLVPAEAPVEVTGPAHPFVSRGGVKLARALQVFDVDPSARVCLDVGASTGGFTDCLLQAGARKVIAVDVGYGQFHWKLRQDPRVVLKEKTNIRYLTPQGLGEQADGAVIDVSFISLRLVIPPVSRLLVQEAWIIALIKPQFEVGKGQVGKGGVVRDPSLHNRVILDIRGFCEDQGWTPLGDMESPILGPKGNREFLLYMTRRD